MRQYLFLLKPINSQFRINNAIQHRLGSVVASWRNYLGDKGSLELEQIKTQVNSGSTRAESRSSEIQVEIAEQKRLVLEKPERVRFRLHNLTKNFMRLQLSLSQDRSQG